MRAEEVPSALILNPAEEDHWYLGSKKASMRFGATDLNPSGDWEPQKPQDEFQSIPGLETYGCVLFAIAKAYIALARFSGWAFLEDVAERFFGAFAGTKKGGTDFHYAGEVLRKVCGLVPQKVMPWTDEINTLEQFYDKDMAKGLLPLGKQFLAEWEPGNEWVWLPGAPLSPAQKQEKIQEALRRGPVCVTVDGSYRKKGKYYTKEVGKADTHCVWMMSHKGHGRIHDQYAPFIKELDTNYDHNAAKVYFLKKREVSGTSFWGQVWASFFRLWKAS